MVAFSMTLEFMIDLIRTQESGHLRFARMIVGNDEDAGDAYSEALVRAFRHGSSWLERIEPTEAHAFAWFRVILRQTCSSLLRKRRNDTEITLVPEPVAGDDSQPFANLVAGVARSILHACIVTLTKLQQACFVLKEFEEQSYKDIAARLGISAEAAKQAALRARSSLRKCLRERDLDIASLLT